MKKRFILLALVAITLAGCPAPATVPGTPTVDPFIQQTALAAQGLVAAKTAVIASAVAVDGLCTQNLMPQAECDIAADSYSKAESVYMSAKAALAVGIDTRDLSNYTQKSADLNKLLQQLADSIAKFQGGAK